MNFVMGIDGGGTKTIAVIADMDGRIIARSTAGPSNPNLMTQQELIDTLSVMIEEIEKQQPSAFAQVTSIFAGISGAGNDRMKQYISGLMGQLVPDNVAIVVEADTMNALYSGTYGEPGMVQISGTGSITYGINAKSIHDRVGGWGYLFGDEGSGYDIGRQGIVAALKSQDGRGAETILYDMLCSHFGIASEHELVQTIYALSSPKEGISPVSKLVFQAYKKDDQAARNIIMDAVKEISLSIKALYSKNFQSDEKVKAVLCGGIFNDKDIMPRLLEEELKNYPNVSLTIPEMSPVGGSIIGAYLTQQKQVNQHIIQHIISTL